jgi:3-hydroxyisobutyrate dehydrogenase-like beta-hydroxyacid dehydrogenase
VVVGLLHPGEMGAAVAGQLRVPVAWASEGRSDETRRRAQRFEDVGTAAALAARSDVILSICPPHAAHEVAGSVAGFEGIYVDANAIAPATARGVAGGFTRFVDGGIVGAPPGEARATHLYLSGPEAADVAELFAGTLVDARVISDEIGAASAFKVAYSAWSKGSAALLLDVVELARAEGLEDALRAEWEESIPELIPRIESARRSAERKGWRWIGEMEEIAEAFAAHDLPDGFHRAAAEVYGWPQGVRS